MLWQYQIGCVGRRCAYHSVDTPPPAHGLTTQIMCSILSTSTQRAASCVPEDGRRSRSAPFTSSRRGIMKLLLPSGGVTTPSIRAALIDLLGKPIAEASALCIPTAQWGHPLCGPTSVRGFVVAEPEAD